MHWIQWFVLSIGIPLFIVGFKFLCRIVLYILALPRMPDVWQWSKHVVGHRGCRTNFNIPENSLLAFEYAYQHGAQAIEVDCMLTADNQVIVMHDSTVDRVLVGSGNVPELTFQEVQSMQFKRISNLDWPAASTIVWPENLLQSERIDRVPSLQQVIRFCQARDLKLMIELKEWKRPAMIQMLIIEFFDRYNLFRTAYVATFNPLHLYQMRLKRPDIPTSLLYCRDCLQWYHEDGSHEMNLPALLNTRFVRYIIDELLVLLAPTVLADVIGVSMVGPHDILVSKETVTKLHKRGVMTNVWVVNNPGQKLFLLELGCAITTDTEFNSKSLELAAIDL